MWLGVSEWPMWSAGGVDPLVGRLELRVQTADVLEEFDGQVVAGLFLAQPSVLSIRRRRARPQTG